jgi:hypothetical protein
MPKFPPLMPRKVVVSLPHLADNRLGCHYLEAHRRALGLLQLAAAAPPGRLGEPSCRSHSAAMLDPSEELITILVEIHTGTSQARPSGRLRPLLVGRLSSEAEDGEVGWGWSGEISRTPFDPLLTRRTLRGLKTQPAEWVWVKIRSHTSRMSLVRKRHRASPQSARRVAGSCSRCP